MARHHRERSSLGGSVNKRLQGDADECEQVRLVGIPSEEDSPTPSIVRMNNNDYSATATMSTDITVPDDDQSSSRNAYVNLIALQTRRNKDDNKLSLKNIARRCACTWNPLQWFLAMFPIFSWLPRYNWRTDLASDIVAGTTVCVMHIPQGMAYALLGNLQPVVGMYMAFFPIIVYSMMGTSRHVSMGTFAVVCLMTGKVAFERMTSYSYLAPSPSSTTPSIITAKMLNGMNASHSLSDLPRYETSSEAGIDHGLGLGDEDGEVIFPYSTEQIATVISFCVGLWQILMGTLRLGSLSVLLSSELVSGFTTGAAVHVLTSQIKNLLGVSLPRRNGLFKIPLTYSDIIWNIGRSNITAILFSIVTISSLTFYNEVLKPIVGRKIPFPLPVELFTIIVGTLVSRYWIPYKTYGLSIVNHIPTGLPTPSPPPIEIAADVLLDSLVIAIVAYTVSISMAKIFATKHNYIVRPNQELIANGTSNFVGSFFMCAPISASLSRSLIQEQVGGKTQLSGLFSCFLLIFVLLWVGPFFETLPHCVLSSMIVVALKGMFLQIYDLPKAFKVSWLNGVVWLSAFISTVVLDIEYGLGIGLLFSIFSLIWSSNKPGITVLGVYDTSDGVYAEADGQNEVKEIPGVKIVKFSGSLNFATVELFVAKIQEILEGAVGQTQITSKRGALNLGRIIVSTISPKETVDDETPEDYDNKKLCRPGLLNVMQLGDESIAWLLLDLSCLGSIDPAGVKGLHNLFKQCQNKGIQLLFCGCVPTIIDTMFECGLLKSARVQAHYFPTVHEAVIHTQRHGSGGRRQSYELHSISVNKKDAIEDESKESAII